MKKIVFLIALIFLTACQDVVTVDLETAQERLVIEALIQWETGTDGSDQTIKLSKTSSFYTNEVIPATGANVVIMNTTTLQEFDFLETQDGIYQTTNFSPILNHTYDLEISYNGELYKAEETLFEAPEFVEITQSIEDGFSEDEPEINVSFNDFIDQENFYRIVYRQFRPSTNEDIDSEFSDYEDRFEENNTLTDFYESDNMEVDDEFDITLYQISERFFNFLEVLDEQAEADFGPFATPPVNVRGNCVNINNPDNYPYGYFSLNQVNKALYVFQ